MTLTGFFHEQERRIKRALSSATPVQTFTATRTVEAFRRVAPHRSGYGPRRSRNERQRTRPAPDRYGSARALLNIAMNPDPRD